MTGGEGGTRCSRRNVPPGGDIHVADLRACDCGGVALGCLWRWRWRRRDAGPHDLHYALGTGQVGSPHGPYPPTDSGTVTGYSVSPALPAGLTLDPTSGVISGTPVAVSSGTYTVTASDAAGAATAALTLVIYGRPLTAVTYTSPATATGVRHSRRWCQRSAGMPTVLRSFPRCRPA